MSWCVPCTYMGSRLAGPATFCPLLTPEQPQAQSHPDPSLQLQEGTGRLRQLLSCRVWEWGVAPPQLSLSHHAVVSESKLSMCCHSPHWEQPVGAGVNGGPPGTPRSCRWVFLLPTAPLSTRSISPGLCSHCGRRAGCTGLFPKPLRPSPEKLPTGWGKRRWGVGAWPAFPPLSPHTPLLPTQAHLRASSHTASLPPLFSHRPRRPVQAHRGHAAAGPGGVQGHFGGAHLPAGRHGGHPQPLHPTAGCLAARPLLL